MNWTVLLLPMERLGLVDLKRYSSRLDRTGARRQQPLTRAGRCKQFLIYNLTSARMNTNVPRVGARLPLPCSLALGA
jgi:hypothetical protein